MYPCVVFVEDQPKSDMDIALHMQIVVKIAVHGAGEMTQSLRVLEMLATLPEDQSSVLRTYRAAHNCLQLHFQGI